VGVGDVFETTSEAPGQRPGFWLSTVCSQILPVQIDLRHDRLPRARMTCATLGALRIRDVVGGDHVYTRNDADIRHGDPETVQIGMPLGGQSIMIQDGREAVMKAGEMVVYDSSRPFTLVMQDQFHWQVFLLPKAKLRRSDEELAQVTAIPLSSTQGMSRAVSAFLRSLAAEAAGLERSPGAAALGENAADLIATMVRSQFGKQWDVGDPDAVLIQAIEMYLHDHHAEPDLGPVRVAGAHGLSVRRLHALLQPTGRSVGERIRAQRLEAIRRDLADPALMLRPIERIAAAHGLRNASAFARLFRSVEGMPPREYRAAALGQA
jgi:AraC-like DNA-binding protein